MIKAESYVIAARDDEKSLRVKVITSISDKLRDVGGEVLKAELVSIFKQLDTIDSELVPDALEIYMEDFKID